MNPDNVERIVLEKLDINIPVPLLDNPFQPEELLYVVEAREEL